MVYREEPSRISWWEIAFVALVILILVSMTIDIIYMADTINRLEELVKQNAYD